MNEQIDFDADRDTPWPKPRKDCPYCADPQLGGVFCDATCPGCLTRHFEKPKPLPADSLLSRAARLWDGFWRAVWGDKSL